MPVSIDAQRFQNLLPLEVIAKQVVEGFITGMHKSPFHGFSVEFAEHRLYNAGESTRDIDWKLYARTEKMFVKRYEEETNLRCQILIDHSSSMYFPEAGQKGAPEFSKIQFSVYAAAALIHLLRKQRDAVGLSLFAESVNVHTDARSSSSHHQFLYTVLEKLIDETADDKDRKTFAVNALHEIAEKIHKRSLVVIFSDMIDNSERSDELFSALQHLRYNKHDVILFHVVDKKKELDFAFDNRPYTFVDLETGEKIKAHPREIRENYLKAVEEYRKELKVRCGNYRIDFVEADIHEGFNKVLLNYLTKRSKLY